MAPPSILWYSFTGRHGPLQKTDFDVGKIYFWKSDHVAQWPSSLRGPPSLAPFSWRVIAVRMRLLGNRVWVSVGAFGTAYVGDRDFDVGEFCVDDDHGCNIHALVIYATPECIHIWLLLRWSLWELEFHHPVLDSLVKFSEILSRRINGLGPFTGRHGLSKK